MLENKFVIAVVSWLSGILASVVVQQILSRRTVLSYFVQHSKLGVSAEDRTFGTVKITWNDASVPNLYLSTVELVNESSRDLQNIRVLAFTNDTTLLSEFPQLVGTTHFLKYSPEYEALLAIKPGEAPTQQQWDTHGQRREYIVPTLNRGQVVKLQYINTSKSENPPSIWLDIVHPGVVLKFRHPHQQIQGVPQQWASFAGVLLGLLFATLLFAYSPWASLTAFGCLFFGLVAQIPGAYVIRVLRGCCRISLL